MMISGIFFNRTGRNFSCSAQEKFFQCTGEIPTLHCRKKGNVPSLIFNVQFSIFNVVVKKHSPRRIYRECLSRA